MFLKYIIEYFSLYKTPVICKAVSINKYKIHTISSVRRCPQEKLLCSHTKAVFANSATQMELHCRSILEGFSDTHVNMWF